MDQQDHEEDLALSFAAMQREFSPGTPMEMRIHWGKA